MRKKKKISEFHDEEQTWKDKQNIAETATAVRKPNQKR
jgi:hypothetical protein